MRAFENAKAIVVSSERHLKLQTLMLHKGDCKLP